MRRWRPSALRPPVRKCGSPPNQLAAGLTVGEVVAYYQPKIDIASGVVTGVEALARWLHPEFGLIGPDRFVPIAEKYDLIDDLTEAMFANHLEDARMWRDQGLNIKTSVNLSAQLLADLRFPDEAAARMQAAGLECSRLVFEITESQLLHRRAEIIEVLARLRILGFEISIDDFGTGHSNIDSLRDFPFCELKIDKSFVRAAVDDAFARTCVEASTALARKLNMRVVAEGVETAEQWDYIASLGIDQVQGYYIAAPMSADGFVDWMGRRAA